MIIQCDHCSAKFRMDDSKLANGPVKVRCAKCKEVFVVRKEEPSVESTSPFQPEAVPSVASFAMPPEPTPAPAAGLSAETAEFSFDSPASTEDAFSQASADFSFDVEPPQESKPAAKAEDDLLNEFDWHGASSSTAAVTPATDSDFDMAAFDSSIAVPQASTTTAAATSAFDSNDFSFDDGDNNTDSAVVSGSQPTDDFSMDFGDVSFSDQPAVAAPAEMSAKSVDSLAADDFLLSFNSDSSPQAPTAFAGEEEPGNVNFGEFSFGDMGDTVAPESSKPGDLSEVKAPAESVPAAVADEYPDDELPPLALTSRKKSGSLFPFFVIFGAIVLIIALAGSGVYFFGGPKAFSKVGLGFLVDWYGDKSGDDGSIVLKGVTASYTVNSVAGELFVVRGEAVNNFKKPRASIQVKVSLLGPGGATLVTKSAYCGNSLSNEQLTALPLAKIEEIMNNQFGDSLANLGLKPGGTIPFVVVVSPVPKESTDYNVQIGGSTVATQ